MAVVERTAEEKHLAPDPSALRQSRHRLVDHRLIYAGGNVLFFRSLIQKRLNVGFCKHTATGGNGVYPRMLHAESVHFVHTQVQKRCHLVDKRTRAAGTGSVHPLVGSALKEDDLGILSAKLDHGGCVRLQLFHHLAGRKDLLYKRQSAGIGKPKPRRTGERRKEFPLPDVRAKLLQHFQRFQADTGHMPLVFFVNDTVTFPQNGLDRSGTDINSQRKGLFLFHLHHPFRQKSSALRSGAVSLCSNVVFSATPKVRRSFQKAYSSSKAPV